MTSFFLRNVAVQDSHHGGGRITNRLASDATLTDFEISHRILTGL